MQAPPPGGLFEGNRWKGCELMLELRATRQHQGTGRSPCSSLAAPPGSELKLKMGWQDTQEVPRVLVLVTGCL